MWWVDGNFSESGTGAGMADSGGTAGRQLSTRQKLLVGIAGMLITVLMGGCGTNAPESSSYSSAAAISTDTSNSSRMPPKASENPSKASKEHALIGVWEGTTVANCALSLPSRCNAQQDVSMTLLQGDNSKLNGYYKCSYGNMNCYNMNETGKIVDGSLNGGQLSMRVMMRDGTSCRFTGRTQSGTVNGGYSCYAGGSILEQGSWRARRSY
jgi:hypothetical protein